MDQNGSISFTTGDNTGRHRIIVYGYDQKGNWVWSSEIFNVETGEGK